MVFLNKTSKILNSPTLFDTYYLSLIWMHLDIFQCLDISILARSNMGLKDDKTLLDTSNTYYTNGFIPHSMEFRGDRFYLFIL
jgi:hypothetical protein